MKKFFFLIIFLLFFIFIILLFFIINKNKNNQQSYKSEKKIKVVASFYPIYFLVKNIGGEKVDVINITPPGVEPHDFEPKTKDLAFIEKSHILFLNGSGVEVYEEKLRQIFKNTNLKIISIGSPFANGEIIKNGIKRKDPHVWVDPIIYGNMAKKITQELSLIDKNNKNYYEKNLQKILEKLEEIDNLYKNSLKNCRLNKIITSHTAFGYLAKRYGFSQIGISGLSPEEEPSANQLKQISDIVKKEGVKYIFVEELVSPIWAETIAREAGVKTLVLSPVEAITEEKEKKGENYFTVQKKNIENLKKALECKN